MSRKKPSDRIAALKAFISSQETRLAAIKSFRTITAKIEKAKKEAEQLEVSEAERKKEEEIEATKVAADQKRKDDQRAKILWGAGLGLLDPVEAARTRGKILGVLSARDRKWISDYAAKYTIALSVPESSDTNSQPEPVPSLPLGPTDPTAGAVMRAFETFDSMILSHIGGEFLSNSEGTDRRLLEALFSELGRRSQSDHKQ